MGSHNQQATAPALSKDTKVFNINTPCTTDDDRWIVKENENKNKPYKQYQAVFDVEPSCKETLNQGEDCMKTTSKSMITDETSCKNPYSLDDLICPRTEKTAIVNNLVSNSLSEHTNNSLSKVHALTDYGTKRLTRTNSASELTRCSVSNDSKCLQEINESLLKKMQKSEVSEVSEVSKSSNHSSLVPCQGSSECLEQCPKQSLAFDILPSDTMLDRVLRCFEPFGVLKPQDTLVSRVSNLETANDPPNRQYPADKTSAEYWDKHHNGPDNWKPDLFFKDFSLEEQQFPDSEHGSISSAADQCKLLSDFSVSSFDHEVSPIVSQTVSCTSPDIHTARYVAEIPSPVGSEENFIITPPKEFQGTDTLQLLSEQLHLDMECDEKEKEVDIPPSTEAGKPLEEESLQDLKPINDSAEERDPKPPDILETTGKFRLITESEYLRAVEYKEDTSISLDDRVESHSNTPPECSLSNLEHPLRAAYLRKLLLENQEAGYLSSQSQGIEEDICIDMKQSKLMENEASLIKSFSKTTKKDKGVKLWNNKIVSKSEGKTESVVMTDYRHFSDSTEYDEKSVNVHKLLEPFTPKDLRLEYQNVPNKEEMTSNLPVRNKPAGRLSDMRALSATSSGSSGTPPPVDFATHPLSLSDLHTEERCSKQVEADVDISEVGDNSVTLNSSNDCLAAKDKCSQLCRMYPEIDSDSEEESGTPKVSEKGNADCSNESEESEEVELFINNPESMVISQINLQPEPNTYEALLLELENKKFSPLKGDSLRRKKPDDVDKELSPSSQASPTPSTDGWSIGAKNPVSDELLNLEGEDFASYLEAVVKEVETQPWESEETENFEFLKGEQIADEYQDKECKEDESCHQALDDADLNSCSEAASKPTNDFREETLHDKITEAVASLKTTRPFFLPKEEPSPVSQEVNKDPPFFQVKHGFETFFTSVCISVSNPKERSLSSDTTAAANTGHAKKTFSDWKSSEEISTDAEFQGRKANQFYHHSSGKDTPITKYRNSPHIVTLKVKFDRSDEGCKRLDVIPERFEDIPLRCAERDNSATPFEDKADSSAKDDPPESQSRGHYPSSCMMYDGASDSSSSSPTAESPELSWSKEKGETEYQFSTTLKNSQKTEPVVSKGETKEKGIARCDEMKSSFDENTTVDVRNGKRTCVLVSSKITYGNLSDNKKVQNKDPSSKYRVTNNDKEEEVEDYMGPDLQSVEAARTRNVVGTFNFLERGSPDNLYVKNSDEQPDSFGDSFVSVNEGITSLGTFNFVGRLDSAPKASVVNNRPAEEEVPSLNDSLISLEDGKHLLGVFDFTKSSSNKLPPLVRASEELDAVSGVRFSKKSETDGLTDLCEGNKSAVISQRHVSHRSESEDIEDLQASREPTSEKTLSKEENDLQDDQTAIFDINCLSRRETGIKPEDFESIEIISAKSLNKEEEKDPITDSLRASTSEEDLSTTTGDPHQVSDSVINSEQGERVVEVYGGVAAHAHAAANAHTIQPVSGGGRSGNGDLLRPQPVDPAHLTSLDLESDNHAHEMLVTDAPHPAHSRHPHDLNHNNPVFSQKPSEDRNHASGRAAKYMVNDTSNLGGLDNFAFDNEIIGQDNYGYDPGYSSERSPEEEEGPPLYYRKALKERQNRALGSSGSGHDRRSLKVGPGEIITTKELMKLFPFISEGTLFEVTVIKNLRGLGLALTGGIECDVPFAGLVRIKKLYPQTPAWLCGQLQVGDIILQANNHQLTGLTSHEALELLRTCGQEVSLEVCRPPQGALGDGEDTPDGCSGRVIVTTSLTAPNTSHNYLSPSPSFSTCGEFEVELTKVAGSLGFTLRKQDNSILGHTIRSLVKEPAISDGRLRPGDKIISVNNTDMCSLSHEEAIAFLRTCPETVTLKLYRDAMQTPISPVSPTEPEIMVKPKALRKEARDMLSDLAFRKQSPCNSPSLAGATSSPGTPRRRRLQKTPSPDIKSVVVDRWDSLVRRTEESLPGSPTLESKISLNSIRETDHETSPFGDSQTDDSASTLRSRNSSSVSSCSLTPSISESSKPKRPSFLDLSSGRSCPRKTQFTPPHEVDQSFPSPLGAQYPSADSIDSAPQLTSTHSDTPAFSHLQQGYHSVNLGALHPHEDSRLTNTTSDHNLSSYDADGPTNNGLLKWKGIVFTPEEEDSNTEESLRDDGSPNSQRSHKPKVVTIELNRGWNSRLGFSLQPNGERTAITAIYADSVAAKDGRLRIGDIVVKVNDVDVVGWDCESVIDLLRKTRGKISLSVIQHPC